MNAMKLPLENKRVGCAVRTMVRGTHPTKNKTRSAVTAAIHLTFLRGFTVKYILTSASHDYRVSISIKGDQ